ncbi:MAG TPA: DUF2442 domain-containing protein [Thermoanaerobaculia bacterium]
MSTFVVETEPRAMQVVVTDDELTIHLVDGRRVSAPLVLYPRLLHATADERNEWELIGEGEGIHRPQIDEDLSVAGILRGTRAPQQKRGL